jgi:hypothetical protein
VGLEDGVRRPRFHSDINPTPLAVLATFENVMAADAFDTLACIRCLDVNRNQRGFHSETSALNTWSRFLSTEMSVDWWRNPQATKPPITSELIGMDL